MHATTRFWPATALVHILSLTAVWQDDEVNYAKLKDLLAKQGATSWLAGNHVLMPDRCRHFTVLAIMKLNGHPDGVEKMREFAGRVFEAVGSDEDLRRALRDKFRPFTAEAYEVRCFDGGIALQFKCGNALKDFRNRARTILDAPVSALVRLRTKSEAGRRFRKEWGVRRVESILDDLNKN